ncbi:MAG: ABC transporter permease [Planctomycetota bacterium]|nr:ABC transporter permease [Planctomycetota bacterium]
MAFAIYSDKPRPLLSYLSPGAMIRDLWRHRHLARQFASRQIEAKYKGQRLGLLWAVLTPLIMLAIYTFVFAIVFPSKWATPGQETRSEPLGAFALSLFIGLLTFGVFRDLVARAPGLIVGYPNYVKKVVFPLQVLAISELIAALVNFAIGMGVWLIGWFAIEQTLPSLGLLWMPLILLPVVLFGLGLHWLFSALGVFLRDLANVVELGVTVLFFLSPIFYSIENVPERVRWLVALNPLAPVLESARNAAMRGLAPDLQWFAFSLGISALAALVGYAFFMKSKRAFGDVV